MVMRYEIFELLLKYFEGDADRVDLWMKTKNPLLGGFSPNLMLHLGQEARLHKFLVNQLQGNLP